MMTVEDHHRHHTLVQNLIP